MESEANREAPRQVFRSYDRDLSGKKAVHPRNPYPGVVVVIEDAERVLLVRRMPRSFQGGKWCLPGGFIEYGEDFLSAGHREVREETGLAIRIESILSIASNFLSPRLHTLVVVLLATVTGGGEKAGDDAEELKWHPFAEPLPEMAFEADRHIVERFAVAKFMGAPVDPRFAIQALRERSDFT
jgi:ADP-ribose pyrophosphatase YjhB (NUDIX family)